MSLWQIFLRVIPYAAALILYELFRDAAVRRGAEAWVLLVLGVTILAMAAKRLLKPLIRPPS